MREDIIETLQLVIITTICFFILSFAFSNIQKGSDKKAAECTQSGGIVIEDFAGLYKGCAFDNR